MRINNTNIIGIVFFYNIGSRDVVIARACVPYHWGLGAIQPGVTNCCSLSVGFLHRFSCNFSNFPPVKKPSTPSLPWSAQSESFWLCNIAFFMTTYSLELYFHLCQFFHRASGEGEVKWWLKVDFFFRVSVIRKLSSKFYGTLKTAIIHNFSVTEHFTLRRESQILQILNLETICLLSVFLDWFN